MSAVGASSAYAGAGLGARIAQAPGALYLLVTIGCALAYGAPGFFSAANLINVALQVAVLTIVAMGMTLVILTEGIDLSLGPVLGLCGVCASLLILNGYGLPFAIVAALAIGACSGLLNGVLIASLGLPPFIVTLGVFGIAQSFAMVLAKGDSITNLPDYFRWFNEGSGSACPCRSG